MNKETTPQRHGIRQKGDYFLFEKSKPRASRYKLPPIHRPTYADIFFLSFLFFISFYIFFLLDAIFFLPPPSFLFFPLHIFSSTTHQSSSGPPVGPLTPSRVSPPLTHVLGVPPTHHAIGNCSAILCPDLLFYHPQPPFIQPENLCNVGIHSPLKNLAVYYLYRKVVASS